MLALWWMHLVSCEVCIVNYGVICPSRRNRAVRAFRENKHYCTSQPLAHERTRCRMSLQIVLIGHWLYHNLTFALTLNSTSIGMAETDADDSAVSCTQRHERISPPCAT